MHGENHMKIGSGELFDTTIDLDDGYSLLYAFILTNSREAKPHTYKIYQNGQVSPPELVPDYILKQANQKANVYINQKLAEF